MSTTESNRAVFERFCREGLSEGNLDMVDDVVDPAVACHCATASQTPGRLGLKQTLTQLRTAFGERHVAIRDIIASGDQVVGHLRVTGVLRDEFLGMAATGKKIVYDEIVIVRFAGGKIVEYTSVADTLAAMRSLGVVGSTDGRGAAAALARGVTLSVTQIESIKAFFARYAERFSRALAGQKVDAKDVAGSFADYFVGASPVGVRGGKNGLLLRWLIPRGFAHYRKIGTKEMKIRELEVEPIDAQHALARVHWDSHYAKKDGSTERIAFENTYLLHFEDTGPKIFAYVTGDEQRVLREHGLA